MMIEPPVGTETQGKDDGPEAPVGKHANPYGDGTKVPDAA